MYVCRQFIKISKFIRTAIINILKTVRNAKCCFRGSNRENTVLPKITFGERLNAH